MMKICGLAVGVIIASLGASEGLVAAQKFKLTSPQIKRGQMIAMDQVFDGYGCTGKNISPELNWTTPPEGTKSLAVTFHDPDAPTGSGWWHWVVFNLPPTTTRLELGAGDPKKRKIKKPAIQTRTDYGSFGYGGPCPPAGDKPHRYVFKVYALKDVIPADREATPALIGFHIHQNKIAEATLKAKFGR